MKSGKMILSMMLYWTVASCFALPPGDILKQLQLPPGFKISVFASGLPNARMMALGANDVVFVGTTSAGNVYAVQDSDGDGVADKKYTIASNLNVPNGVAFRNGSLYVAEIRRIIRYDNIVNKLNSPPAPAVVYDKFPADTRHGWKFLRFGPDGKLYTAVGAPCNVPDKTSNCKLDQSIYGSLVRLNADGSNFQIIARGIRNTEGFDWQPGTGALYFTENGRDMMGDETPPDELNKWSGTIGEHFGFPTCHGGYVTDLGGNCSGFTKPVWNFFAHAAPLGMRFYRGNQFPAHYKNRLLIALHGSWNRTVPRGYRVPMLKFDGSKFSFAGYLVSGWLTSDRKILGRPVDILGMRDGSVLISDDMNGIIYRVSYSKK